ncbi:MAG: hypothetical protein ACODAJ_02655, partial [Planctomycetota bacterium]
MPWILRGWTAALVVAAMGLASVVAGEADEKKMEEEGLRPAARGTGSRFVHRIKLIDEAGNVLTAESTAPYSPRQTCSSSNCHDVDLVNQGTHSQMFPAARPDPERPPHHAWTVYYEQTGTVAPVSHGFLPGDGVPFDDRLHLTVFDLVRAYGQFHPGGGRLEVDSEGQRYDERMAADEKLEDSPNPDYNDADWVDSGVLEHDCMACHALGDYDHVERATEIDKRNFKWAATVGAGLGVVEGRGDDRKVAYNADRFDGHDKVLFDLGRPADRNCLVCHVRPALGQTTWRDCLAADVHSQSGLACVDCHTCEADHVMFGDRRAEPQEAWASLTCQGCHDSGRLGSPIPEHEGLPRLHLDRISCEACHSGPRPRVVPLALQQPEKIGWDVPQRGKGPMG